MITVSTLNDFCSSPQRGEIFYQKFVSGNIAAEGQI